MNTESGRRVDRVPDRVDRLAPGVVQSLCLRVVGRTKRTLAVVDIYGQPAEMEALAAVAADNDLRIIEDTAQAFGAEHKGRKAGASGDAGAFSFFPSKNLGGMGDGGLIATDDDEIAELARMLRVHGGKHKYHNELIGYNSRLDAMQAAVLRLLRDLTDDLGVSMFYISHDLSTVSYICDRVNVMYLGRIVESAATMDVLDDPKHPYTRALLEAIPIPDPHHERQRAELMGMPGDATDLPTGCRFKDRCPERMDVCDQRPVFDDVDGTDHRTACHLHTGPEAGESEPANDGETAVRPVSDGGERK
jgi:oligopeptide/dipeptide ABC transporter ATP-binding protein